MKNKLKSLNSNKEESSFDSDSEEIPNQVEFHTNKIEEYKDSLNKIGLSLDKTQKNQVLGIPDYFCVSKVDKPDVGRYVLDPKIPLQSCRESRRKISRPEDFDFWTEAVIQGLNILLYGPGSKLQIMDGYLDYLLAQSLNVIRVNAFNPVVTLRKIFIEILSFLGGEESSSSLDRLLSMTLERLDETEEGVFLLIDNIDSKNFIENETQTMLSRLAYHKNLYLICSLDNPYLLYRWSIDTNVKYNFLYIPCVSISDYSTELMYTDGLKFFNSTSTFGQMRAIEYVLRSLTGNQRSILKELCQAIMKNPNGINFKDFLGICVEEMLVTNSKQLKDALVEALDHQIAAYKQGQYGETLIVLKLDPIMLSNKISN